MKKQKEIKVTVIYTPGWEERVAIASYKLYKRIKASESSRSQEQKVCA